MGDGEWREEPPALPSIAEVCQPAQVLALPCWMTLGVLPLPGSRSCSHLTWVFTLS